MDFSCFNTEIATRPERCPELSSPLTEEELDDLWFFYALEFGHLDIPVRAISSGPWGTTHRFLVPQETHQNAMSALEHLPSSCTSYQKFNDIDDTAFTPDPTTSMGQLTDLIAQSSYTFPVSKQRSTIDIGLPCCAAGCPR